MLREESEVYSYKHDTKVYFSSCGVESVSCKQGESVHEGGNDCKYSSHREYVVEMSYDVVGVVKDNV